MNKQLGKAPAKHDRRLLKFAKYLIPAKLPPVPRRGEYKSKVPQWPMYGNDILGDCVPAGMGHMQQQWSTYSGNGMSLSQKEVIELYTAVGGYIPGKPQTDQGVVMLDAMKYWVNTGIGGQKEKIVAFAGVNPHDLREVATAIMLFGNCFLGLAMPKSAQTQDNLWTVVDGPSGQWNSWGGHAVPLVDWRLQPYHHRFSAVTWGTIIPMTGMFLKTYCDESYVALSDYWLNNGLAVNGFNKAQLLADLNEIWTTPH